MVFRRNAARRLRVSTKYLKRMALLLVVAMLCLVGVNQRDAQAQATSITCAVTPSVVDGQGFNVAGLGFNVAGLGFNVAGLGFNVAGLGFNVAGLGLNPTNVANEIRNATISAQWLTNLKSTFEGGTGFNSVKTAILILDDTFHGNQVQSIFNLLDDVVNMSNVTIVRVDIGGSTGYQTDAIADKLTSTIDSLWAQGYRHFVVNMSFGLVPCNDTVSVGGKNYNWNFSNMLNTLQTENQPDPQVVRPILECVTKTHDGKYYARWGYLNESGAPIVIPLGNGNKFTGNVYSGALPTLFQRARQQNVFETKFDGNNLVWTLTSPDGSTRTATANKNSTKCNKSLNPPTKTVEPLLDCVAANGDGSYTARFGYKSAGSASVNNASLYIPAGNDNYFNPAPQNRNQPGYFMPGPNHDAFRVVFNGSSLTWKLKSPDGKWRSVTASSSSPKCPDEDTFGMDDYISKSLGVPNDKVDDFLHAILTDTTDTDNPLQKLRNVLRNYINRSANPNDGIQVYPVASSGNFRPWFAVDAPLAPARWMEVISVGATVGNEGPEWFFSHTASVLAPGVSHRTDSDTYVAGTSFAAPFVSMYLGQWATYPKACSFTPNGSPNPPLKQPGVFGEKKVSPGNINDFVNAFTCAKPLVNDKCYATSVVSFVQGKRKDGQPVLAARSDPNKALGAPQKDDTENFVALGLLYYTYGELSQVNHGTKVRGEIVLKFDRPILNSTGKDVRVWETSFGDGNKPWSDYPEAVQVYASADGTNWKLIGSTSDKDQSYDLGWLSVARYIKLVDITNPNKFGNDADGFDVDAVEGFVCDGAGSTSRLVTEDPSGSGAGGLGMRGVSPVDPAPQGNTGTLALPTAIPAASGGIPLPPPPGN